MRVGERRGESKTPEAGFPWGLISNQVLEKAKL
jgi:hypothetical protein